MKTLSNHMRENGRKREAVELITELKGEDYAKSYRVNLWKTERSMMNLRNTLLLKQADLSVGEIGDILRGAEASYPLKTEDAPNDGALAVSEFLDNEMSGYETYFDDYAEKWLMYQEMFEEFRGLKGLMRKLRGR